MKSLLEKQGRDGSLHTALSRLAEAGCSGKFHPNAASVLCCANLIPLTKKDGGTRPIAVGETLRRLIGKCLLQTPDVSASTKSLQPRQVGVGVQGATELVGMGVQRLFDRLDPQGDWVLLQVDVKNAFNTVDRSAVLQGARNDVPGAYNWLAFCYADRVPLFCQGSLLCWSQAGVHQGDTCGPLGFALGLNTALDACRDEANPLLWEVWYLDDGTIVGSASHVMSYLQRLHVELRKVGLVLNPDKCRLIGPGIQASPNGGPRYPRDLALDHFGRAIPVVPFSVGLGITTLGVPADVPGGKEYSTRKWHDAVGLALHLLERLQLFPGVQIRHALLRYCLDGCRVMHLLRSTPLDTGQRAVEELSSSIRAAADDLVGTSLPDLVWAQATLPISSGGLGIKDPHHERPHARMAALSTFELFARDRAGVPEDVFTAPSPDLLPVVVSLQSTLGVNHEPLKGWASTPSSHASATHEHASQRWWAEQVAKERGAALHGRVPIRDQCRLEAQRGPYAYKWLSVLPSGAPFSVSIFFRSQFTQ